MIPQYASPVARRAHELISSAEGIVIVYFIKRSTNELRRMACIYNAQAAGRARFSYDPVTRNLLPVFDVEHGATRMIPLDGVLAIKQSGIRHQVSSHGPSKQAECISELQDTETESELRRVKMREIQSWFY